jgi:hypothetical protein
MKSKASTSDHSNVTNKDYIEEVFHTIPEGAYKYGTSFKEPPDKAPPGVWLGGPITERSLKRKTNYTSGDANCFYAVSSFYQNEEGQVRRSKDNFAAAHVITLDDIGNGPSAKISKDKIKLEPSFVIETSPDNCQPGYILTTPEYDADLFNRVVDALVHQGLASESDPGMKGVTRYVRMPVGTNNKTKYDPPHQHVLKGWHPERRYTLQEIIDAYGLVLAPPTPERTYDRVEIDVADDPYVKKLGELGLILKREVRVSGDLKMLDILCPFHEDHTDRADEGAVYVIGGGYDCKHGHCQNRNIHDLKQKLAADYGVDTEALDREMVEVRTAREMEATQLLSQQLGLSSEPWSPEEADYPTNRLADPITFLSPPGLAGAIAQYHNGKAFRVAPIYGLVAALASMSALSAGRYALEMPAGPASTNLFVMALGGTGSGKEGLRSVVKDVLKAADDMEAETSAASDIGLLRKLEKKQNAIWIPDEFGRALKSASNPSGGHQYALITIVMKLYGLALSSTEPHDYADAKKNIAPIESPYLSVMATATRNSVTNAMTSEEVVGGTLNRFIVIPNNEKTPPFRDGVPAVMSDEMKTAIHNLSEKRILAGILANEKDEKPTPYGPDKYIPVKPTDQAVEALLDYRGEADKQRANAGDAEAHLWARSYENALRVAGCIAIGDSDPDKPVLTLENAQWAIDFMRWSTGQAIGLLDQIADSDTERDAKRIVAFVKECVLTPVEGSKYYDLNKKGWVPRSQITRKFRSIETWKRKQLLDDCVDGQYLEFKEFPAAGNSNGKVSAFRPLMGD